ncbi:hypothetical protein [Celeribacter litoreus]|uniref:hypothetical protein n=1 Tax=Celeribacter litoreus TaxID=2876714 RepID=UPI001CCBC5F9|nr:hypothetical protein [Celeribacter litoreus]MCA0043871.1 hypothetical protein [Celeribacter litoreus]
MKRAIALGCLALTLAACSEPITPAGEVVITEGDIINGQRFRMIKPLTLIVSGPQGGMTPPTEEQAKDRLRQEAKFYDAGAVTRVMISVPYLCAEATYCRRAEGLSVDFPDGPVGQ